MRRAVVGKQPEPEPRLRLTIALMLKFGLELAPELGPSPAIAVVASRLLGSFT